MSKAMASFSICTYLSSAPLNARLIKYTSFCTPSSSQIRATLTVVGDMARYRYNTSPGMVWLNGDGLARYFFRCSNACSHSSNHLNAFSQDFEEREALVG
jgi:hypothetical protein